MYERITMEYARRTGGHLPRIVIDSLPVTREMEQALIHGNVDDRRAVAIDAMLRRSVDGLLAAGATVLAMPCNTLHTHIRPIVDGRVDVLDIIDVTLATVGFRRGVRRMGVIGSTDVCRQRLYENDRLETVYPDASSQKIVCDGISALVREEPALMNVTGLQRVIDELTPSVDCVALACTDFHLIRTRLASTVPLVDSLDCLVDACVDALHTA
jgi:aspartate racemase